MIGIAEKTAGASVIDSDRMWHYVEGIGNWPLIRPRHGIGILPGLFLGSGSTPAGSGCGGRCDLAVDTLGILAGTGARPATPTLVELHQQRSPREEDPRLQKPSRSLTTPAATGTR